jgi:molecular chaperone GrpE (heat shock protein)
MLNSLITAMFMRRSFIWIPARAASFKRSDQPIRQFFTQGAPKSDASGKITSESESQEHEEKDRASDDETKITEADETLKKLEVEQKSLHHKLLLKYADAENVRRERVNDVKRRDAQYIAKFGDKVGDIYDSLVKVCDFASGKAAVPNVDEKVKSLTEGLVMTKGLMRNILEKHNIRKNSA